MRRWLQPVLPAIYAAGWKDNQIKEQATFTLGRIIIAAGNVKQGKPKRVDYLLSYRRDFPLAVVEAKSEDRSPGDGLQQAKDHAQLLDLVFAYSTNGPGIIEHDFTNGLERELASYPGPDDLWRRYCAFRGLDPDNELVQAPYYVEPDKPVRYYQDISIHRTTEAIIKGKRRVLSGSGEKPAESSEEESIRGLPARLRA